MFWLQCPSNPAVGPGIIGLSVASNDTVSTAMWGETKTSETRHDNKQMEVRREAVGSDRRDESVMGPPQIFGQGVVPRKNHRDIPTGEDAPSSVQAPTFSAGLSSADMQRLSTHTDENREEETTSAQLEASANGNDGDSRGKGKNYKIKEMEAKESDHKNRHKVKKQDRTSKRSSTPEKRENDSRRHRHRSRSSSVTSSSNEELSSEESDSPER